MEFGIIRDHDFDGAGVDRQYDDVPHLYMPPRPDYDDTGIFPYAETQAGEAGVEPRYEVMLDPGALGTDLPEVGAAEWRDRTKVEFTTLQHAVGSRDMPRAALTGRLKEVTVSRSFCVVVGDGGTVEVQQQLSADVMTLDGGTLRAEIGLFAGWALDRLIENPDSRLFNGLVRALVGAALTPPVSRVDHSTQNMGDLRVATIDCDNVVIGARPSANLTERRDEDSTTMKLARVLPGDRDLTRSLALVLGRPDDPGAREEFMAAADKAATRLEDTDVMDAADADGGTSRATIRRSWDSITADGMIAAVVGSNTKTTRRVTVTIDEIAVTGVWPENAYQKPDGSADWYELHWYLLKPPFRRV